MRVPTLGSILVFGSKSDPHIQSVCSHLKNSGSDFQSPDGTLTFTCRIEPELVIQNKSRIAVAPGLYQELVPRSFELRVTAVGSRFFTSRIDPDASVDDVDWRRQIFSDIYSNYELPSDLREKLRLLHKAFGLYYCAYDLIVNRDGVPIFLEANPAGQWLWLEERLKQPISQCIADELVRLATPGCV